MMRLKREGRHKKKDTHHQRGPVKSTQLDSKTSTEQSSENLKSTQMVYIILFSVGLVIAVWCNNTNKWIILFQLNVHTDSVTC